MGSHVNNSEFEDYADGMFPSPMLFSGVPHIVPPPLMPHILFPDPTKEILNQFDSFINRPESAHSKESCSRECNPGNPKYEIADIFRLYWEDYQAVNPVTDRHYKVVYDILNCRTGNFGYSISACDTCAHTKIFPNSCRNSHCPKCQGNKRMQWVDARLEDLLPVPYYHSVFTLPNKIFPLCLYNQRIVYDLLFRSAADTLMQFGADPKWLGGKAGFFYGSPHLGTTASGTSTCSLYNPSRRI